jgi:uncharacterized protein
MTETAFTVTIWPIWMGGLAIGLYIIGQQLFTNKALGCSTPFANACSIASKARFFQINSYKTIPGGKNLWFLIGILIGGFLGAYSSNGTWSLDTSLSMGAHYDHFMPDVSWQKALTVTFGGVIVGIGARLAGGCTSGHSMAGISMLNPVSMLATALFFIGGIIVLNIMNLINPFVGA